MCALETTIVLVVLTFNFILQRSHYYAHINLAEVNFHGLCKCNSNTWGWHNSYQSGVIGITDKLNLQYGTSFEVYRMKRNNNNNTTLWQILT